MALNINSIDRINDTKIDLSGSLLIIIIFGPTYQRINETMRQSTIFSSHLILFTTKVRLDKGRKITTKMFISKKK